MDVKNLVTIVLTSTLVAGLVTGLLNALLGQWATLRQVRRDRYSKVVGTLVERRELPYRIRRRTDDRAETLANLRDRLHTSQEQMAVDETWVAADSRQVHASWEAVRNKLDPWFEQATRSAWTPPPPVSASQMNLEPPLPGPSIEKELRELQTTIEQRTRWFGL